MMPPSGSVTLPADQSGRLELARWMASKEHPLTSRVIVNRVWGWHFGAGLVSSPENFGSLGDRPSHPELLDWLADYFVNSGWSIKELHRVIVSSSTYQMASAHPDVMNVDRIDPENRLRWRFPIQRLDAEQIRDAILAVSGRLESTMGGKTVPLRNRQFVFDHTSIDHTQYDSLRRALYLPVIRNNLYALFEQFDYPDPTTPTGQRTSTTVAPQALFMMNSELVMDAADALARMICNHSSDSTARIVYAYQRAFGREPTLAEILRAIKFIEEFDRAIVPQELSQDQTLEQRWSLWCQSLLTCNEFMYVR